MATRLYTFTISHFAEKARWALDYKGVHYEEQRLVPGSHAVILKRIAPASSVPVLQDDARVIQGSSGIIDYVDQRWPERPLTPTDPSEREQALEFEQWLDRELGETLRRAFYCDALNHRDLTLYLFTQGGPLWGRLLCRVAFSLVARRIRQMYSITAENAALDRDRLGEVFERLEALLDKRRYLVGDRFSRADLTLAALAAPMWDPQEHSTRWPPRDLYPPSIRTLRAQFEKTRAHDHVMRLYREHRRPAVVLTPAHRVAAPVRS
jgi:glutathione S-transferase